MRQHLLGVVGALVLVTVLISPKTTSSSRSMIGHPQVSDVVVAPIPPPAVIYPFDHVGSPCVDDVRLLAEMACSECLICSREERAAVMQVAVNRARKPGWWGRDLVDKRGGAR